MAYYTRKEGPIRAHQYNPSEPDDKKPDWWREAVEAGKIQSQPGQVNGDLVIKTQLGERLVNPGNFVGILTSGALVAHSRRTMESCYIQCGGPIAVQILDDSEEGLVIKVGKDETKCDTKITIEGPMAVQMVGRLIEAIER